MNTVEELRAAYPDLCNQVEAAAVEAERTRIKDIEDIADAVGDDALVQGAKYGDNTCTAQDLALRAMKEQSKIGAAHLANAEDDHTASGADDVGAAPNGGETEESDAVKVANIVNAYQQTKSGGKKS